MFGRRNIRDSVGYVTLGLFAHAVLDELLDASRDPDIPPSRGNMIQLAVDSLQAIDDPRSVDRSKVSQLVFQRYQEVHTLRRLLGRQDTDAATITDLATSLHRVLESTSAPSLRHDSCQTAISFFRNLAREAAMSAEFPEEQVPAGVRGLASRIATA